MGSNEKGKLGLGNQTMEQSNIPCLVDGFSNQVISNVSCGANHTIAVNDRGEAYSWGESLHGALGQGMKEDIYTPTII